MLGIEREHWNKGYTRLAGVDEAGRGPLAGPVVAGAVVFDREFAEAEENGLLKGVTDSKKLSESCRERIYKFLRESPSVETAVGLCEAGEIDEINILRATHAAMARALLKLPALPEHALVDGLPVKGLPCSSTAVVKGDAKSLSIAAASIVAKVVRDRLMKDLHNVYPQYAFAKHKGYGTKVHMQALFEYGPSPIHRRSFRCVSEAAAIHAQTPPSICRHD